MTCAICSHEWNPTVVLNKGDVLPTHAACPICGFENEVEDDWEMVEEI